MKAVSERLLRLEDLIQDLETRVEELERIHGKYREEQTK